MYRALIVCNSRFPEDPGALAELRGPKVDGIILRDALTDPSTGLFERSEVRFLPEAESAEIIAAIDEFFGTAEADDTLLFYYSGHGRSRNQQLFLCAGNTRVERLHSTTVAQSVLSDIIAGSFAQVKIVVLDCCQSGVFKGDSLVDGLSGKGRFVIAATSATDPANDADVRGEPSPFTQALVEGLLAGAMDRNGDSVVDLDDLFVHLSGVKFDGHEPHRSFDGAGAVPIARRSAKSIESPVDSAPDHASPLAEATPDPGFLDSVAAGSALSDTRVADFRRDLRDDMAAALPSQLTSTEFLQRAGLVRDGLATHAGVLLFGENPTLVVPTAMVSCVRFHGTRKTDPLESVDLHGTIPELIVQARDFVAEASRTGEVPTAASAFTEATHRFPMIAVREIIANAVVHRDYTTQRACVHIHVFDDRIEVISPGTWGGEQRIHDGHIRLGTLERQSQPRNFRLARVLSWVKLVESVGAGLPRSVADCRAVGAPEPVVLIRQGLITVTIFPREADHVEPDALPPGAETRAELSSPLDPSRIAQVLATGPEPRRGRRVGSGYRVTNDTVLTVAHLVHDCSEAEVSFVVGGGQWTAHAVVAWVDVDLDVAVLRFEPPVTAPVVAPVQYGRVTTSTATVSVETAGFPRFKLRESRQDGSHFTRDLAHVVGTASSLSNLRSGTLEINVLPPSADDDPDRSPWEGMSGAGVFAGERLVGMVTNARRSDGPGRLEAVRMDRILSGSSADLDTLASLLELTQPVELAEVPARAPKRDAPYAAFLRELIPRGALHDREHELADMADFCHGDESYMFLEGGPWSGKTALAATLALNPPSDVDVLSFFITHRIAGQGDGFAFTDALVDQLAWLLEEPVPTRSMQSGALELLRRQQLAKAVTRAHGRGRRVLLIVDGLDEDEGLAVGRPSIASMLPVNPDNDLRVLVTSRPGPLPADVPLVHPLRSCRRRILDPSATARELSHEVIRELRTALTGSSRNRDIIGLIAASEDGLSTAALMNALEIPPYEVEAIFSGSFGRIFAPLESAPPAQQKIRFVHQSLLSAARELIGSHIMQRYLSLLSQSSAIEI